MNNETSAIENYDLEGQLKLLDSLPRKGREFTPEIDFQFLRKICTIFVENAQVINIDKDRENFFTESLNCYARIINNQFVDCYLNSIEEYQSFLENSDHTFAETLLEMLMVSPNTQLGQFQELVYVGSYKSAKTILLHGLESKSDWVNNPAALAHLAGIGEGSKRMQKLAINPIVNAENMMLTILDNTKVAELGSSLQNAILAYCGHGKTVILDLLLNHGASINSLDKSDIEFVYEYLEAYSQKRDHLEYLITKHALPKPGIEQFAKYPWLKATYIDMASEDQSRKASDLLMGHADPQPRKRRF